MALRIAILGAGYMGRKHAVNAKALGATVVGVCGRTIETAQKLATEQGAAAYTDCDAMLDAVRPDALVVCLPPYAHTGQVESAARRGVALFLEKPLSADLARATAQVAAIEAAGVISMVGFHMRFAGPVRKLRALIDSGAAGRPTLFTGAYMCNALHAAWWRDVTKSGGQAVEQAIHIFDLATHFMGRPTGVFGKAANLCHTAVENYTSDDTSAAVITFDNGAMATMASSNCAVPKGWAGPVRAVFQNVTVSFESHDKADAVFSEGRPSEEFWSAGTSPRAESWVEQADPYVEEMRHFLACLGERRPTDVPAAAGLLSQRLAAGVVQSSREGRYVAL